MVHIPRWKIFFILAVCVFGFVFALPNAVDPAHLPSWLHRVVNLGLELRGGSHLQYEIDLNKAERDQMSQIVDDVRQALRKGQIGYTGRLAVDHESGHIQFVLRDIKQLETAKKVLQKIDDQLTVEFTPEGHGNIFFSEEAQRVKAKGLIDQSIEVIRRRIDEDGTKEPIIQRQGRERIIVQLPGVQDPAKVKKLIGTTAKMTFHLVDESAPPIEILANGKPHAQVPPGSMILPLVERMDETEKQKENNENGQAKKIATPHDYLIVKKQIALSGERLKKATAEIAAGRNSETAVSIAFDQVGARKFADITQNNAGKRFAIVLDGKVLTAPRINEPILGGSAQITGSFTIESANDLALMLRAGALPAPLKVIEERTIGPSLGADSIHDGKKATLYAFIFVAVFMVLCYGTMGVIADIALVVNMVLLFSALSLLQATLTLPGIAGIAVSIGMAVDANVLIYERIKEELRGGMRLLAAVDVGYKRAMITIVDSNLTTLIGAAILYQFGTGPIKGFAVTLSLAIIISMYSAISLSRLIIVQYIRWTKATDISI